MRLTVLTSNNKGGVLQFAQVIAKYSAAFVDSVVLVVPENAEIQDYNGTIYGYKAKSTLNLNDKNYKDVADYIIHNSDAVIICDDALIGSAISIIISKVLPVLLIVHDVRPHYANGIKLMKRRIKLFVTEKAYKVVLAICLLSESSKSDFLNDYPLYKDKTISVKLGAHLTTDLMKKPLELNDINDYILFFGRIEKYKGLDRLLREYHLSKSKAIPPLVIAGAGDISDYEQLNNGKIIYVNRYIADEEMNWLFANCRVVVLPYTSATQSGIIPIAYHYNKPVLISNLLGLVENVIEHKTGEVFRSDSEIMKKIEYIIEHENEYDYIEKYYNDNYNWNTIVGQIISFVMKKI